MLFPLHDKKSRQLLKKLVTSSDFDSDMLNSDFHSFCHEHERKIGYVHLADRLNILHQEVQNPRPRGWLQKEVEVRSGSRHMMMATLVGVIIAILLGTISLGVSSYQAWVAYQAWQHPVAPPER